MKHPRPDTLAPYAVWEDNSKGRQFSEASAGVRSEFQRDRDRIIHSAAFRRLEYKTQVFVNHEGDLYRTRLTHTLEVAQIGRTLARLLNLNEDLTEAICLAHDLGHTPFGHAGQDALNGCMSDYGGFEHNLQSIRTVDTLEEKYADFPGLNLCFETREGILKHCSKRNAEQLGELGARFLNKQQPSLEAQIANLADEIAYNNHDMDDGLRAGLITVKQLCQTELFDRQYETVIARYPKASDKQVIHETIRRIINEMVTDVLDKSQSLINQAEPMSLNDIHATGQVLIRLSESMQSKNKQLKTFLRKTLYQHYLVRRMTAKADRVIGELFAAFMADPLLLPPQTQTQCVQLKQTHGETGQARAIADYIAGMTDRYAIKEYSRVIHPLTHF